MTPSNRFDILPGQDDQFLVWGNLLLENLTPAWGIAEDTINDLRTKLTEIAELINKAVDLQNMAKHIEFKWGLSPKLSRRPADQG